ncbi:putative MYND domain protein [Clohesyomyces aquaticus]|uniref:Putative MYND domain protein n=1 Tax=Clohesyomyces aquaticus TaxID=1231657 RepID=A0A1Y1ZR15_9PLEO|nr:putative MYND domain protein [Clohesyomyces aquaticus]
MANTTAPAPASGCATCQKTSSETLNLKNCAQCKSIQYCSRDCQKADWKTHKKACALLASGFKPTPTSTSSTSGNTNTNTNTNPPTPKILEKSIPNPFTRLDSKTYLHDRPPTDVYKLLVDAFRLRQEDDYKFTSDVDSDSIYGGRAHSLPGFRRFLGLASSRPGLLPPWWNDDSKRECEAYGMNKDNWSDLRTCVEKHDIIEHYGDSRFPMQLRMLGESVYGTGPMGQDGTGMRKMMMMQEGGGFTGAESVISTSHIDMSGLFASR